MATQGAERWTGEAAAGNGMRALVSEAWAATDVVADKVGPSTREAAFKLVLEAMLRDDPAPPSAPPASSNGAADEPIDGTYATPQQRAEAIGSYLGLPPAGVRELYDVSHSAPQLQSVRGLEMGTDEQIRLRVALLVCAGRTAVGLDTGTEHIRRAVIQIAGADVDPSPVLEDAQEFSLRGGADSPNRLVRLTGWGLGVARDAAQALVCP